MLSKRVKIASRALGLTVIHYLFCTNVFSFSITLIPYNFYSCYTRYNASLSSTHMQLCTVYKITRFKLCIASRRTKVHWTFVRRSLRPSVGAVLIRTHVIQSHFLLSPSSLRLEKYSFSVIALRAWMFLGSRQRRIRYHVGDDVR